MDIKRLPSLVRLCASRCEVLNLACRASEAVSVQESGKSGHRRTASDFQDFIGKFEIEDGFVRTIAAGCEVIHGAHAAILAASFQGNEG
jgi:hypothetical protein